MNTRSRMTRIASAALLAVTAPAAAFADNAPKKDHPVIDRMTTGTIASEQSATCKSGDARARLVCRTADGGRSVHFPPAPINPAFGL